MFSINTIEEIFASLKHNKLRTVLTGLSVSWGIFILIVLLGAGNGLKNGVTSNFSELATNTVQMWAGNSSLPYKGLKSGRTLNFGERQLSDVDNELMESDSQTGVIEKQLTLTNGSEYGMYGIKGVNPTYLQIFNLKIAAGDGRFVNNLDMKSSSKVMVIDKKVEEVLFKGKSAIGKYLKVGPLMFRVIGVNSKKERWGNGSAYIPFTTAQYIFNPDRKFYSIAMTVKGLETKEANEVFDDKLKSTMSKSLRFDPKDTQALWVRNFQRQYIETQKIFQGIACLLTWPS